MSENEREIGLFEFVERKGARRIRKESKTLSADHPLRDDGRALALRALEDVGILLLVDREQQRERAQVAAEAADEHEREDAAAELAMWSRGGVDLKGLAAVFDRQNTAAAFEIIGKNGGLLQWRQPTPAKSIEMAEKLIQRGRGVPALRPKNVNLILSIVEDEAAGVAKKFELPDTLSWTAEGWRNWLYAGAPVHESVIGDKARVIVSNRNAETGRAASLQNATWHRKPGRALDKKTGRLARVPHGVADLVRGMTVGSGKALDTLLVG